MSSSREVSNPRVSPLLTVLQQRSVTSPAAAENVSTSLPDVPDNTGSAEEDGSEMATVARLHPTLAKSVGGQLGNDADARTSNLRQRASSMVDTAMLKVMRTSEEAPSVLSPGASGKLRSWINLVVSATKGRGVMASLLLMVAAPTFLAIIYFGLIASNQYVTEVKFALRSMDRNSSHDPIGATPGMPGASSGSADSFIVADFISTRQFVDEIESKVGLRQILSRPSGDFLSRFNPSAPIEALVDHWRSVVNSRYELSTGILSVKVRAFTPEDSLRLGQAVVESSERLANELTGRGRQDMVRFSEAEVKKAEQRLQSARLGLADFRRTANTGDRDAAAVRYTALEAEQGFAERDYGSAVQALRSAQALADRQQVYLATFAKPALAESSLYPNRLGSIGLVFGLSLLFWTVTLLIVLGIRDHMR